MEIGKEKYNRNLLAVGIDERVFTDPFLRKKVLEYGSTFDSAHIVCRTSDPGRKIEREGIITFYPVYSRFSLIFPLKVWFLGKNISRKHPGNWLVSSDSPFEVGLVSWLLARCFGGSLFIQIHTDFMSPYFRRGSWKEGLRYYLTKFVVPRADCIRVVSERIKRSLLKSGIRNLESKITVLPIVTEIDEFLNARRNAATDERFKNYEFKMVAVGRFVDKEKNFRMLIDMMRDFTRICPKSLLVLVGDGPDRVSYESRVKSHGLEKCVILERWRDDLPSFLKSFDLFLMSSNYEGWGRVVVEAMAAGLPVVMTDVGLAGEVVNPVRSQSRHDVGTDDAPVAHRTSNGVKNEENGVVVPVADKVAMLQAVTDLYKNPELRTKFSEAGLTTIQNLEPKNKEEYLRRYKDSFSGCLQKL